MSTKFSIRPAARKRPWICKRSPPCLIPPIYPPSLLATFALQRLLPPPQDARFTGSLLLHWWPTTLLYRGVWIDNLDTYSCTFWHNTTTGLSHAFGEWDLAMNYDRGPYPEMVTPLHPLILYDVASVDSLIFPLWRATLTITG